MRRSCCEVVIGKKESQSGKENTRWTDSYQKYYANYRCFHYRPYFGYFIALIHIPKPWSNYHYFLFFPRGPFIDFYITASMKIYFTSTTVTDSIAVASSILIVIIISSLPSLSPSRITFWKIRNQFHQAKATTTRNLLQKKKIKATHYHHHTIERSNNQR